MKVAVKTRTQPSISERQVRPGRKTKEEPIVEAYCLKCRVKREMQNPTPITMKNGKPATEGKCPECGTKMFKIGKA